MLMKIKIVLYLSDRNNAEILVDADKYVAEMTNNPYFSSSEIVAQIEKTTTATNDLRMSINAPLSENKTQTIKLNRNVVDRCLTKMANMVEDVANDPEVADDKREIIAISSGMSIKNQTRPSKHVFSAKNDLISGSVVLSAAGGNKANEWQYTTDVVNFTNRISADTTTTSKTKIQGLDVGVKYAFFHKAIVTGGKNDWEGPIFLIVT